MIPLSSGHMQSRTFHAHLNQMPANIDTIEKEEEGRLAFLDVMVTCSQDQLYSLQCTGNQPKDQYIPYHSHNHPRMLTGVMRGMRNRALRVCDKNSKQPEIEHLARVCKMKASQRSWSGRPLASPKDSGHGNSYQKKSHTFLMSETSLSTHA